VARGHGDKLSRKQEQAIAALLAQPTIEAAARAANVAERTLKGWLVLPEFAAAYARARREVLERTVARLLKATGKAVDTLEVNLVAERPSDQIRAAVAILEHAGRGVELLDLAERLAEVERRLAERCNS
jgi:hypothetical protein